MWWFVVAHDLYYFSTDSQETCFLCFVQGDKQFWKMFTSLFRIKQVKALKKVWQELFTSMQTGNPKTKKSF